MSSNERKSEVTMAVENPTLTTKAEYVKLYLESDHKKNRQASQRESYKFMVHYEFGGKRCPMQINTCQSNERSAKMVASYFLYRCQNEEHYLLSVIVNKKQKLHPIFTIENGNVVQTYKDNVTAMEKSKISITPDLIVQWLENPDNIYVTNSVLDREVPVATSSAKEYSLNSYVYEVLNIQYENLLTLNKTPGTKSTYKTAFERHLIPYFKALIPQPKVAGLTSNIIREFYTMEVSGENGIGDLFGR